MFNLEKIKSTLSLERGRQYAQTLLGSVAVLGSASAEIPRVYRTTNSVTMALAVGSISLYNQLRHPADAKLQNSPADPELLPPSWEIS